MRVARLYMQRMRLLRKKYPKLRVKHIGALVRDYANFAYWVPPAPSEELMKEAKQAAMEAGWFYHLNG